MKLKQLLFENVEVGLDEPTLTLNEKGKVQTLSPELKGSEQCPFWKHLKQSIAHRTDISEEVRIPKKFAEDTAKRFKVPLEEKYSTPICINGSKICSYFVGANNATNTTGKIICSFGTPKEPAQADDNIKGEV